ncbi:hypothetical protein [Serratia marcescens]|uniref:hypothetical protein n=1 Tax=Serratia marcescens TaxID=615 RepID=UPI001F156C93|nr:hypothetical protein [Serratia marcescens]
MGWDKFVYENIKKQLVKEGFSEALAQGGASHGADLYRRKSQASRKGMIYDDCLTLARQYVLASCTKEEKPESGKKKSRTAATARPSLF